MQIRKTVGSLIIVLLLCGWGQWELVRRAQPAVSSGADYSDILFYSNCDSNTSGQTPQKGSGTIEIDAGILLNTSDEVAGTGCLDQNNDGWDSFYLTASGNFSYLNSRIGFYWNPQEELTNAGVIIYSFGNDFFIMVDTVHQNIQGSFRGTSENNIGSFSVGTWYFIELKFSGSSMEVFVDGLSVSTITGSGTFNDTVIRFGAIDGNAFDQLWDQIIISNNNTRDLNAVKAVTNFT